MHAGKCSARLKKTVEGARKKSYAKKKNECKRKQMLQAEKWSVKGGGGQQKTKGGDQYGAAASRRPDESHSRGETRRQSRKRGSGKNNGNSRLSEGK